MAAVSDVAVFAFHLAEGCRRILEPLLCFLGDPSPRSPAADAAAVYLLVVLPTAFLAGVFVAHFAGVAFACLNLHAPAPAAGVSFADLWRFVLMVFALVFAWLLAIAVFLAFYYLIFLAAGKRGSGPEFCSCSVLA
ncbi:unnamed protein product [Alopecurus aequalis]